MKDNEKLDKRIIYQNLRNEMLEEFKRQDTYLLSSYTLTITLWTIALETQNEWIAILPCIILIPLSMRVCDLKYASTFLSAFIANFIEDDISFGWEGLREKYYLKHPRSRSGKLLSFFSRFGFCILSIVGVSIFWILRGPDIKVGDSLLVGHILIFAQIAVITIQFIVCLKYADTSKVKEPLLDNWK